MKHSDISYMKALHPNWSYGQILDELERLHSTFIEQKETVDDDEIPSSQDTLYKHLKDRYPNWTEEQMKKRMHSESMGTPVDRGNQDTEEYNFIKQQHPDWSDEKIMIKLKMNIELDKAVDKGQDPQEADVLRSILERVKPWLEQMGVAGQIIVHVSEAIVELKETVEQGIKYVGQKIEDFLNWLF